MFVLVFQAGFLLYKLCWAQTHRNQLATASQVLGLEAYATIAQLYLYLFLNIHGNLEFILFLFVFFPICDGNLLCQFNCVCNWCGSTTLGVPVGEALGNFSLGGKITTQIDRSLTWVRRGLTIEDKEYPSGALVLIYPWIVIKDSM